MPSGWRDISPALDWITATTHEFGATERQQFAARLCTEELLTNLHRHNQPAPTVSLFIGMFAGTIKLVCEDEGSPFDPTQDFDRPPLTNLEMAHPGGWGLALVRRFSADFTYHRSKTKNLLQLSLLP